MQAPLNAGRFAHDTNGGTLAAKIEVAAHNFADLDRRLSQVDVAIKETAKRGKTIAALSAIEGQRKGRAGLVDERKREAGTTPGRSAGGTRHGGRQGPADRG